jgi:tetratricopeptide (TPR) repeat protein
MYQEMKDTTYPAASNILYDTGMEKYNKYQYEEALKDFKQAYKYSDNNYETLYQLAMCYKRTGDVDKATQYFYDIINNSGDEDLIRRACNYGLDMQINDGKQAAQAAAGGTTATTETSN